MVDFKLVNIRRGPGAIVVVLERVSPLGTEPEDYCVHGKTKCIRCEHWVWLGEETYAAVSAGKAAPLCMECGAVILTPEQRIGRVEDALGH